MKTIIIAVLFCLACGNDLYGQKKAQPSAEFFIAKMKIKFDLALKKDTASLRPLLHDSLLYIHSGGNADTKEGFLNKIANSKNPYKSFTVTNERVRYISKNIVLVHGRSLVKYENGESSYLLITETYIKEKKNWLLISRHANKIEPGK